MKWEAARVCDTLSRINNATLVLKRKSTYLSVYYVLVLAKLLNSQGIGARLPAIFPPQNFHICPFLLFRLLQQQWSQLRVSRGIEPTRSSPHYFIYLFLPTPFFLHFIDFEESLVDSSDKWERPGPETEMRHYPVGGGEEGVVRARERPSVCAGGV